MVSIPKKVIPTSVRRSRLKRLVREAMRSAGLVPETAETWKLVIKRDPPKDIRMNEVASVLAKLAESKKC